MSPIPAADLQSFSEHLQKSTRILALLGAGLSASSGLPTFRGAGGIWRNFDATLLATPKAFSDNPGLVWQFYGYRRHMALDAKPNRAHYALAELARRNQNFITLSQNVDGLSPRANHPAEQLHLLHGSLFDLRCTYFYCTYSVKDDFTDPLTPALSIPTQGAAATAAAASPPPSPEPSPEDKTGQHASKTLYDVMQSANAGYKAVTAANISDPSVPLPSLQIDDLPKCPKCGGLLRPGVVWFGEELPAKTMKAIDDWIDESEQIDLMLVIGTSSKVWPAAGYVEQARAKGARVAVVNMDRNDAPGGVNGLKAGDWFFEGDASEIVPEILKDVIGEIVQPD